MKIRPATRQDLYEMTGDTYNETIRAFAVDNEEGDLLAVAGIRNSDPRMCFADIKEEIKKSPRTIMLLTRKVVALMDNYPSPIFAIADEEQPTAFNFLQHVGFEFVASTDQGEVFQWHK